jgi:hypothetical protein
MMRFVMTDNHKSLGEAKEKKHQSRLIGLFITSCIAGIVIGFSSKIGANLGEKFISNGPISQVTAIIVATLWAIFVPILFFKSHKIADEHENIAYLWSGTIGSYFMMIATPIWWLIGRAKIVPPVDAMIIMMATVFISALVALWIKYR